MTGVPVKAIIRSVTVLVYNKKYPVILICLLNRTRAVQNNLITKTLTFFSILAIDNYNGDNTLYDICLQCQDAEWTSMCYLLK